MSWDHWWDLICLQTIATVDKIDKQIGEELRRIVGAGNNKRFPVMSGTVKEIDSEGMTCTVQLDADADETPTDGILLNVILENVNGIYMLPVVGANSVVAEVNGPGQLKQLLWSDSYTEVSVTVNETQFIVTDGQIQAKDGGGGTMTMTGGKMNYKNTNGGDLFKMWKTHLQNMMQHVVNVEAITTDTPTGMSGVPENDPAFAQDYSNFGQDLNALGEILY